MMFALFRMGKKDNDREINEWYNEVELGRQIGFGKGCTIMLRKLNWFLTIVIGSFIGIFVGFGIYKFWHFKPILIYM